MSASPAREVEAKLKLPRPKAVAGVEEAVVAAGLRILEDAEKEVTDTYLDSEDWFFWRAGLACRVRESGGKTKLAFKALRPIRDGVADREEWEEVVPPSRTLESLPEGELAAWMGPLLGGRKLARIARVDQVRRKLLCRQGRWFDVEVSADVVSYARVGKKPKREGMVELELVRGKPERIAELSAALQEAHGWAPDDTSKLARALQMSDAAPPEAPAARRPQPTDRAGQAFLALVASCVEAIRWNEAGTRVGVDAEYLHDMRVSSRRTLAALTVFAPLLPPRTHKRLRKAARRIAGGLGAVRDLDVQLGRLPEYAEVLGRASAPVIAPLRDHLRAAREGARVAMLGWLDSPGFAKALGRFDALDLSALEWKSAGRKIAKVAPGLLEESLSLVVGEGRAIVPESPVDDYHELRWSFKRLRYNAEFFRDLAPDAMQDLRKHQVALQDLLGAHQDACVARATLTTYATTAALTGSQRAGIGRLIEHADADAAALRARFPEAWAAFDEVAFLKRLRKAL